MQNNPLLQDLHTTVQLALAEDIGTGDITAELIDTGAIASAKVICREQAVICGQPWVNEVFRQIDANIKIYWQVQDGEEIQANQPVFTVAGSAQAILTAERSALNFLQTLSSVATDSRRLSNLVSHSKVKILDTRKTLPGLRRAQKYAVRAGGCQNHRIGLYDAFLIKENHINACGGINLAINRAKKLYPDKKVEIEVESIKQMNEAITAQADIIMLDNFELDSLREAVRNNNGQVKLEASGGYDDSSLVAVADTGVDYISVGSLTKHCTAIDFSMLFD
jgi:nicotinate-nucleotide pyrophosphorylase (carboxylating)